VGQEIHDQLKAVVRFVFVFCPEHLSLSNVFRSCSSARGSGL
jgi:hypothetical protein